MKANMAASVRGHALRSWRRSWSLGAWLLVAVVVSGCGHLTGQQATSLTPVSSGNIGCIAPSRPAAGGGCATTDTATGITVRVANVYADVTGTLVQLLSSNTYNYPLMLTGQLTLKSGLVLQLVNGSYTTGDAAMMASEPLPSADIKPNVEIIATATFGSPMYNGLYPPSLPPSPPWLNRVQDITIHVPFTISPTRGGGFIYHQSPMVEHGIGVQVQSLDYAPAEKTCFGEAGGARVEIRFTGLPADLELLSFNFTQSQRSMSSADSCMGGGTGSEGSRGPNHFMLTIPGMSLGIPLFTQLQSPVWPTNSNEPSSAPTVGSAGTVEFEVAYPGSGTPTGAPATLTISGLPALTNGMSGDTPSVRNGTAPTLPTYNITLPMQ